MRHPASKCPGAVRVGLVALFGGLLLFLAWLALQPQESLEQEPDPQAPKQESVWQEESQASSAPEELLETSGGEESESEQLLPPESEDGSLETFVDWAIWYGWQEPTFPVREDGSTVYGELFDDPYAQWCTEFLLYCLQKAEDRLGTSYLDSVYPWYPYAYSCGLWFKAYYHYFDAGTYTPERGDMVFFDSYGIGYPDHVGMVTDVVYEEDGKAQIITMEGNIPTDEVPQIRSRQMDADDEIIVGYGSIRQANYAYSGPITYYGDADAPEESEPPEQGLEEEDETDEETDEGRRAQN